MLSASGMFGKEKKARVLPDAVKKTEAKFNFTFTYGFALVSAAEQKEIEEQVSDLAEEIWKLHKADKNIIEMAEKSFAVYDKSVSRLHDRHITLSKVEELCNAHEKNYKNALPKLQRDAAEAQWEEHMRMKKTAVMFGFKLEVKDSLGHSCVFTDFDGLREFIHNQQAPAARSSKRPRR